ncbi:MAG TPA: SRPBCC domain-containing protein [Solirubrobacterales bacterium]|jgi:uncharacterized protein YndB with AHSA1/START domain
MSDDHRIEITIDAPPSAVYDAIATGDGVRAWWTEDARVAEEVGGVSRMTFGREHWTEMRVDRLVPGEEVGWACVDQYQASFEEPDEWVGTTISFRLEPEDGGERTRLHFVHSGLEPLDCAEICRRGWDHYIRGSLRSLLESGAGTPSVDWATSA